MNNYGQNTKKYAEAMEWRDWQTCELICSEHEGLLQAIVKLEQELSKLRDQLAQRDAAIAVMRNALHLIKFSLDRYDEETAIDALAKAEQILGGKSE